jgi:hypothetical protein
VADFLRWHLQEHRPEISVVPARARGTPFSPDDPAILAPVLRAGAIFLGPGSPTYATRQLEGSLAWAYVQARHRLGAALVLASAATIAASQLALPVYELYKVGEELHWSPGLDLLGPYGLSLVFVPHWDNAEGGAELDTSRCFMGRARFDRLRELLPADDSRTIVGIDEHTALVLDLVGGACEVLGRGGVTLVRGGAGASEAEERFVAGRGFPADLLGPVRLPAAEAGLPAGILELARAVAGEPAPDDVTPAEVLALVAEREAARARHDWPAADALRQGIVALGWQVSDTLGGPQVARRD